VPARQGHPDDSGPCLLVSHAWAKHQRNHSFHDQGNHIVTGLRAGCSWYGEQRGWSLHSNQSSSKRLTGLERDAGRVVGKEEIGKLSRSTEEERLKG
jgi:hypothetical protein